MASGDTRTQQYLGIAANGNRADLPGETCCETRTQTLTREVAERVIGLDEEVQELKNNPDVVDIVATYQDLENYDTSTLTDKDIIRVLQDSTHNGNSTYYRWNSATEEFDFVGEISGGGNPGEPRVLTEDDYNWNSTNRSTSGTLNSFALWLLDDGLYTFESGTPISKVKTDKQNSVPGGSSSSTRQAPTILVLSSVDVWDRPVKTFMGSASMGANPPGVNSFFVIGTGTDGTPLYNSGSLVSQYGLTRGDVVNNLTSSGDSLPLSATQGKVLNDKIGGNLSNLTTTDKTSLINAINELEARVAIERVSGATPTIVGQEGHVYICGEVTSLNFTPSATGLCEVIFTSGATPTNLTIPNTVMMPDWFVMEANKTYEISVLEGTYGAVMSWS